MELICLNKNHIDDMVNRRARCEGGDEKAFLFMIEDKKKNSALTVVDGVAKIDIVGLLGDGWYYDTEYSTIISQTIVAEGREDVDSIDYIVDSPGGLISGCEECARAIASVTKPTRSVVKNLAASAAYWLASQTNKIDVVNESAKVGSIGIMAVFYDYKKWEKEMGIQEIKIISSNAPDKNPDPATTEGHEKYQAEINQLHEIFAKNVATGRGVTVEKVNADYGKGGILFAKEAKEIGMIDEVNLEIEGFSNNSRGRDEMAEKTNAAELETAIVAAREEGRIEGIAEGTTAERTRIESHLGYLGAAKNETILANIKEGAAYSDSVEQYAEEKYAAKELAAIVDGSPSPEEKAGPDGEEKPKEQSLAENHKRMFKS